MNENPRLPVPRESHLPARRPVIEPTVWQQAAPAVARSAALIAVGLIGEWVLRSMAQNAFAAPRNGGSKQNKNTALVRKDDQQRGTVTISETVIMTRRVVFRR